MRWLFHVARAADAGWDAEDRLAPPSLAREGFIHASYRDAVAESARLYLPEDEELTVLAIDPRRLDVPVEEAMTPRGPMPHVVGSIPRDAVRRLALDEVASHPDAVTGTRIALCGFEGMTLLDLVGPLDVLSRIASMGFDPATTCEVVAIAGRPDERGEVEVFTGAGARLVARRYRPSLDAFDLVVVAGGHSTRALIADTTLATWLSAYPPNRLLASVCTGALLLGAAGRLEGRRATTHASALDRLAGFGATHVDARVVDDGQLLTSGGVTAGIDLGLHLVRRLVGPDAAAAIRRVIESDR